METVWYDGPSGGEHVPNPSADWMREVMRRGDTYWEGYSPVATLVWHKHRPQKQPTRIGLGTQTEQSQLLFIWHPKLGWYFEYSTFNQPEKCWLVVLHSAEKVEKWIKHWACGEQLYFRVGCFVPQELAEQIVTDYLTTGAPSPAVQWMEFDALVPRQDPDSHRKWLRERKKKG